MFTINTYRDVLSENGQRGHHIGSAWIIAAALALLMIVFV